MLAQPSSPLVAFTAFVSALCRLMPDWGSGALLNVGTRVSPDPAPELASGSDVLDASAASGLVSCVLDPRPEDFFGSCRAAGSC